MKDFTQLYVELDQTNKTNEKIEAMRFYFERAAPEDAASLQVMVFVPASPKPVSYAPVAVRRTIVLT